MPDVDGVTATRLLREADAATPVLVLTTFEDEEILAGALRAGAAGFLLKGVPAEDLQRAVRGVAGGESWLDPAVTGRVLSAYREGPTPMLPGPEADLLTPREREVLALIGAGAQQHRDRDEARPSARGPSRPTSGTSSQSSTCATAPRPWCSRSTTASSSPDEAASSRIREDPNRNRRSRRGPGRIRGQRSKSEPEPEMSTSVFGSFFLPEDAAGAGFGFSSSTSGSSSGSSSGSDSASASASGSAAGSASPRQQVPTRRSRRASRSGRPGPVRSSGSSSAGSAFSSTERASPPSALRRTDSTTSKSEPLRSACAGASALPRARASAFASVFVSALVSAGAESVASKSDHPGRRAIHPRPAWQACASLRLLGLLRLGRRVVEQRAVGRLLRLGRLLRRLRLASRHCRRRARTARRRLRGRAHLLRLDQLLLGFLLRLGRGGLRALTGLELRATSPLTDASSIWATSRTSTSARAEPLSWASVSPSASITGRTGSRPRSGRHRWRPPRSCG